MSSKTSAGISKGDGGNEGISVGKDVPVDESVGGPRVSFRDKVLEGAPSVQMQILEDLIHQKLAQLTLMNGDRMLPMVTFDDSIIKELSQLWRDALVIKLLGKTVNFIT